MQWLCDVDVERSRTLATEWQVDQVYHDHRACPPADIVLVATPPSSHAPITCSFLERGCHVLCEKPIATRYADAEQMVHVARRLARKLSVGMVRRFYPPTSAARALVASGALGEIRSVEVEESVGRWVATAGPAYVSDNARAGGGVLMETGSHVLDQVLYVIQPSESQVVEFRDNSLGGPESDAAGALRLHGRSVDAAVTFHLSRTAQFRQRMVITGSLGAAEVPLGSTGHVLIHDSPATVRPGLSALAVTTADAASEPSAYHHFAAQLRDLARAARSGDEPLADASTVLPSVRLIEECYARREPLAEPWVTHLCPRLSSSSAESQGA